MIKKINTRGIGYLEPLSGNGEWYWGNDCVHGDLYEAEELFQENHPIRCNRLVFVHVSDGRVVEPIAGREGQYFGRPVWFEGKMQILLVDFPKSQIRIFQYEDEAERLVLLAKVPLAEVVDCYNLMLERSPLMLTRQANDGRFQIVWPEKVNFAIGERESFFCREGDRLYFSRWWEDPEYREEVVVRKYPTGEVLECFSGILLEVADGQRWLLQ